MASKSYNSAHSVATDNLPFSDLPHYIGQCVKVKYAGETKEGEISRILDEAIIKYRVKGCGSKKYTSDMMEVI